MNAREFLKQLHEEIETHPGVNHPMLCRVSRIPFTREDYKVFGLQHYALVGNFTAYLEHLLITAPDSDAKQWLAKVLVDEYGEGSEGKDHAELYREFLAATGAYPGEELVTDLHENVSAFVAEHFRIVKEEPFLVGLGAVGPGHEWSIPKMFPRIVRGLRMAGFDEKEIEYFVLHLGQDIDHGMWLEEALARYADDETAQRMIRRGALLSLEARSKFWSGVQDKVVRWRQPRNTHMRTQNRRAFYNHKIEAPLKSLQAKISVWRGLANTA